ncbi:hypothetical protein [Candidatus Methanoprimaticola sp. MG2]|uniref:hypothetical protein n=1 Tax=Candidatus Methanoprimaticola sp. MG2 TaxID=3228838 RepID=UPI0039C5CDA2
MVFCAFCAIAPVSEGADERNPATDVTIPGNSGWPEATTATDKTKTIVLDKDITITSGIVLAGSTDLKIDLNGHTITADGVSVLMTYSADTNYTGTLTIDGSKEGSAITTDVRVLSGHSTGGYTLNVIGGTYTGDYTFLIGGKQNGASGSTATFTDAVINGSTAGIWMSYGENEKMTVDGCTIDAPLGIYAATTKINDIKDTVINSSDVGIDFKTGTSSVTGCTILVNNYVEGTAVGNNGTGDAETAIVVTNQYDTGNVSVKIDQTSSVKNTASGSKAVFVSEGSKNGVVNIDWEGNDSNIGYKYVQKSMDWNSETGKYVFTNITNTKGLVIVNGTAYVNHQDRLIQAKDITSTAVDRIVVENEITLTSEITINFTDESEKENGVKLGENTAIGKGTVFQRGSIEIINASLKDGDITISGDAVIYGTYTGTGNITINNGATLTIPAGRTLTMGSEDGEDTSKIKLESGSTLNILGNLEDNTKHEGAGNESLIVPSSDTSAGDVNVGPNATVPAKNFVNDKILVSVDPDAMVEASLGGTIIDNPTFGPSQIVTVNESLVIMNGATVTIAGKLIVPEGMTITIEAGGKLILQGLNVTADINGTVVIEGALEQPVTEKGIFKIDSSGDKAVITVDGDIQVYGLLNIAQGKVVFNANADIAETGIVRLGTNGGSDSEKTVGTIVVSENSVLTINGNIHRTADRLNHDYCNIIENNGTIIYDSEVAAFSNVRIYMMKSGATVDIQEFTIGNGNQKLSVYINESLEIKDEPNSMEHAMTLGIDKRDTNETDRTFSTGGIVITASAKLVKDDNGDSIVESSMDISGTIKSSDTVEAPIANGGDHTNAKITLAGKDITISSELVLGQEDELDFGKKITGNYNPGTDEIVPSNLTVTGKIDATAGTFINNVTTNADEEISGITLKDAGTITTLNTPISNVINATMYETQNADKDKVYNYATIDAAMKVLNDNADVKKVTVLGEQELTTSAKIPADKTLAVDINRAGELTIGCVKDHNNVTLDVDAKGKITGGAGIKVIDGTVYAADKTKVSGAIVSDVKSYEVDADGKAVRDGWGKWTTLALALKDAEAGQTIEVSTTELYISSNMTIDEGVTVKVPAITEIFEVKDGITFTVDGILIIENDLTAETTFAKTAVNQGKNAPNNSSVIVVNGMIRSNVGATYDAEGTKYLSTGVPVSGAYYTDNELYNVVAPLSVALENLAKIDGDITIRGKVTAGDVAFTATDDCTTLVVDANAEFNVNSITLVKSTLNAVGKFNGAVTVGDVTFAFKFVQKVNIGATEEGVMQFTDLGQMTEYADENKKEYASMTLVSGTYVGKEDLVVRDQGIDFVVASGSTLESEAANIYSLIIEGTVSVASEKALTATNGEIKNGGVLSVAAETSTEAKGTATFTVLIVGHVVKDDTTGATAAVNGPVSTVVMYVAADTTMDEATLKSLEDIDKTEYYVDGALWMTVYDDSEQGHPINFVWSDNFDIPVKNARFTGWEAEDVESMVGKVVGDVAKVDAKIDKEIYGITILANEGVNDIFIDGQILVKDGLNIYTLPNDVELTAGTHEITFELNNGFTGEGKLALVGDGVTKGVTCGVNGLSITLSGVPEGDNWISAEITLQLTGIEKSGFTPDQPDTPAADNGMTITDYLLIILVVLIVVMAIIVAMRLMRS